MKYGTLRLKLAKKIRQLSNTDKNDFSISPIVNEDGKFSGFEILYSEASVKQNEQDDNENEYQ